MIWAAVAIITANQPTSTQAFEFRGMTTNTTEASAVQLGVVASCKKHLIPGVRECTLVERNLAGFSTLFATAQFRGDRLVYLHALVANKNFLPLAIALTQKYGKPCLANPPGNSAASGENGYWCFSDGAVRLRQFGTGGMSQFDFYARSYDDIIADLQPKIDF